MTAFLLPAIRLWAFISAKRKWQLLILLVFMLISSLLELVSIGAVLPFLGVLTDPSRVFGLPYIQPFLELLNIASPDELILPICIVFGSILVVANACRVASFWLSTRLSYGISLDLGVQIYKNVLHQPYAFHIKNNSGAVIGVINKSSEIVSCEVLPMLSIIQGLFLLFFILTALIAIDWVATLVAFGGLGLIYVLVIASTKKALHEHGKTISAQTLLVNKIILEGLGGIKDILIDGTQNFFSKIYENSEKKLRFSAGANRMIASFPHYGVETVGMLLIIALAYFLNRQHQGGGLIGSLPVLGALALGAQRLMPVMQQIYSSLATMKGNRPFLKKTLELISLPRVELLSNESSRIKFNREVSFENMSFKYEDAVDLALQDINLTIPKGSTVGLIGKTGCGKTTLVNILMGLLWPNSGCLKVDGAAIDVLNLRSWQENIAHVPQEIFLLDGTLIENIAIGIPHDKINLARVEQSICDAQLEEVVDALPERLNASLGERGIKLSGGQRQRIGLARALYKNADILIFDEATSALDSETENSVMEAIQNLRIRRKNLTIVMIAHRLSTLRSCDFIITLEAGKITSIENQNKHI